METWKEIKDFPLYEVSSLGRVRGKTGKVLKPSKFYSLHKDGIQYKRSPTRLLRENFSYEWIKDLRDGEEVKPLKEYPGYFITSMGRVWSVFGYRFLSIHLHRKYYYCVKIKGKSLEVHTLVGRNFLPEYREGLHICHKEETLPYPEINYKENL